MDILGQLVGEPSLKIQDVHERDAQVLFLLRDHSEDIVFADILEPTESKDSKLFCHGCPYLRIETEIVESGLEKLGNVGGGLYDR